MKNKISNQFFSHYLIVFIISIVAAFSALLLISFANDVISKTLVKNNYTAKSIMQDDYTKINTTLVTENGGGIQIVDSNYDIVLSYGLDTIHKNKFTVEGFTEFLTQSKSKGIPYSYDITYNSKEKFWLIVTFPTSIRLDFAIVFNKDYASKDMKNVLGALAASFLFYLLLLAISAVIYSKVTAVSITNPLKKLCDSTLRLRDGDYSERVNLNLNNEFGELEDTYNAMAEQIEYEICLRKQSEENRKKLILDISHDLKNPLSSILGYVDLCRKKQGLSQKEQDTYLKVIYENSIRANQLLNSLFSLSKIESAEFRLNPSKVDTCEYIRETMGNMIDILDQAGFLYEFDIPEIELYAEIDTEQMNRVFQNLVDNMIQYNSKGTTLFVRIWEQGSQIVIFFMDNGIGIPAQLTDNIFKPFVRVDQVNNSQTGGTGLGLAIVSKIIELHNGTIQLITDENTGCVFEIKLPKI